MDELTSHFDEGPSGRPVSGNEHNARHRDIHAAIRASRLVGPDNYLETGHRVPIGWGYGTTEQWTGWLHYPRPGDRREHVIPLGTVDAEVPQRLAEGLGSRDALEFMRRTM